MLPTNCPEFYSHDRKVKYKKCAKLLINSFNLYTVRLKRICGRDMYVFGMVVRHGNEGEESGWKLVQQNIIGNSNKPEEQITHSRHPICSYAADGEESGFGQTDESKYVTKESALYGEQPTALP